MSRGEDVVKGKEYTSYPHPPPSTSNYRDINPTHRVRPESNQGCKQDYVVRGNTRKAGTNTPPPTPNQLLAQNSNTTNATINGQSTFPASQSNAFLPHMSFPKKNPSGGSGGSGGFPGGGQRPSRGGRTSHGRLKQGGVTTFKTIA